MPPILFVFYQLIFGHFVLDQKALIHSDHTARQQVCIQPLVTNIFCVQLCHGKEAQDCHNIAAALLRAQQVDETRCK